MSVRPVRAVFAGETWHGATGGGLADGLRALGWLVHTVDELDFMLAKETLPTKIEARLLARFHRAGYNRTILAAVAQCRAELLLTVKGNNIAPATLKQLRAQGVRTVNYYPDFQLEASGYDRTQLAGYDLVATTKSFQIDTLGAMLGADRVAFVHHGYIPEVHRPTSVAVVDADYDYDIVYVGNASPYKLRWLAAVAEACPDRTMAVVGARWRETAAGTALAGSVLGYQLSGDYFAEMVCRGRVNIALHMGPGADHGWEDLVSTRTFEIPACGGFMLHIDNPEVRSLFRVPDEIDTFATPEELVAKIRFYLDHHERRRAIAVAGHARATPAYSLHSRARAIVDLLANRRMIRMS